ncbi:MAG: NAD(+) kinase [Gammaproteobacteria bacterium]|nr:NAD(+) kinase [Gammaproteobacteria bacterium]
MPTVFKTIGLIGKYGDPSVNDTLNALRAHLQARGLHVLLDEDTAKTFPDTRLEIASRQVIGERCDLVIVVGGDGTLLNAARALANTGIPLAGINLGRLGFLADISPDRMIERMEEILRGHYLLEERCLLHSEIKRADQTISGTCAFNDMVVHKWNILRMIEFETYIDGQFVNSQRADGLIVATPTGSTAYALSGGGPILHPTLNAIALVPICPHTLSSRPIVVSGDSHIDIVITDCNHDRAQLTGDGQLSTGLREGDHVHIRKKERPIRLIHPADHDHYQILRAKLRWGEKL